MFHLAGIAMPVIVLLAPGGFTASAEPNLVQQTDPRITPGQVIDGWGRVVPCRCRFQGQTYRLGEIVCMTTHLGTVLTRCELYLNNTSWMPSTEACSISGKQVHQFASLRAR